MKTYRHRLKNLSTEKSRGKSELDATQTINNEKKSGFVHSVGNTMLNVGKKMNDSGKFNQDVPLNRFIAFSWSYLFFLMVLISYLLLHEIETEDDKFPNLNRSRQILLTLYIISFVLQDINTIMVHKKHFLSSFWRVYDYVWHLLLLFAWLTGSLFTDSDEYLSSDPFVIGKYIR